MKTVDQDVNVNENEETTAAESQERTFTQSEVNALVAERLSRAKAGYADYDELKEKAAKFDQMEEASKSELQKALEKADSLQSELDAMKKADSVRSIREKVAEETKVPVTLLTAETEEECKSQAEAILAFKQPDKYPSVKDGGEAKGAGATAGTGSNREKFAEWAEQSLK